MIISTSQFRIKQPDPKYNLFYLETRQGESWVSACDLVFTSIEEARKILDNWSNPPEPIYHDYP